MFPRTLTFPFMNGLCPCLCGRLISEEPFINDISILIWKFESETQSCPTLCDPMYYTVHVILQARILEWVAFPFSRGSSQPREQTQGSNPGLLHCRRILCKLSHKGRAKWVAYPFPRGSSLLRNWTRVSCIAGGFFTNWAIGEDPKYINKYLVVYKQITLKHMSYENFIY